MPTNNGCAAEATHKQLARRPSAPNMPYAETVASLRSPTAPRRTQRTSRRTSHPARLVPTHPQGPDSLRRPPDTTTVGRDRNKQQQQQQQQRLTVRNFTVGNAQYRAGEWDVAAVAKDTYDLEGKVVGTLGSGRIGSRVLQRLKPFDCAKLTYYDYQRNEQLEKDTGAERREDLKQFLSELDVLTINCPLYEGTRGLIDAEKLSWMKKGAWIVNTARGAIVNAKDVAAALESGHIRGYGGDVTEIQPAPRDHPFRTMYYGRSNQGGNAMTPHVSGTSLDAQARYANGVKDILTRYFAGQPQEPANVIVEGGDYATKAYGQRK